MLMQENVEAETVDELPSFENHARRRSSLHIEDDYLEGRKQLTIEHYLADRRRSSRGLINTGVGGLVDINDPIGNNSLKKRRRSVNAGLLLYSSEPVWDRLLMQEKEPIPVNWKDNPLDKNSIYSIKKESIAGRDLQFLPRPMPRQRNDGVINNTEQQAEHDYIVLSNLQDNSQTKFNKYVLQHFFRAPAPRTHPGYGMPRPETAERNPFRLIMADLERDLSIVPISSYPSLSVPSRCSESREFCEILGNSSCSSCIEKTNRFIGDELQRIMFPQIEITKHKLVQPKLEKVMRDGHLRRQRRRRLREIEYSFDMSFLRRQDTKMSTGKKVQMLPVSVESGIRNGRLRHSSQSKSSRTTHLTTLHEERLPS